MKKLIAFTATLVAVFMFGSVAVAAAAPEWLENGAAITVAKASTITLPAGGTILLEDMALGVDVTCNKITSSGLVGPKAADLVEAAEAIPASCTASNGGAVERVKGVNLPWVTELILVEPKAGENLYRDVIKASVAGKEPGWELEVSKITDTCTSEAGKEGFTDMTNEGNNVDTLFNGEAPAAKCTIGGAKEGLIEGLVVTSLANGKKLEVSG